MDLQATNAAPFGWHDTDGQAGAEFNTTWGNNVDASDANGSYFSDGGSGQVFNFPLDLTKTPATNLDAAIVNSFYWANYIHDIHYQYGFTEAAGNYQFNNDGNGGIGGDQVECFVQVGAATDNAFFAYAPDGQHGQMIMGLTDFLSPNRDSAFDATVLVHEFGHGVTSRLTGGPSNVSSLNAVQSNAMAEGWSDWYSLMLLQRPTDTINTSRYIAGWYFGDNTEGGPGIRNFPYNYDMSKDRHTIADFNGGSPNHESHNAGEIWASTLWDMNWLMIQKYGYSADLYHGNGGNNKALQLVMDALKPQPTNPSFRDARDAILLADQMRNGGANQQLIWQAFARRGLGLSFDPGASSNATTVVPGFDVPTAPLAINAAQLSNVVEDTPLTNVLVATFTDSNGNLPPGQYAATINWGDGNSSTGMVAIGGSIYTVAGSHTYLQGGTYTLGIGITRNGSSPSFGSSTVVVADLPITATGVDLGLQEGSPFSGTAVRFVDSDPGPNKISDDTVTIDWGDGQTSLGTVAVDPADSKAFIADANHTYKAFGSNTITSTVQGVGGSRSIVNGTATITDAPLTATGVNVVALQGVPFAGTVATYLDANSQATGSDISATIDWGDGTTSAGTIDQAADKSFRVTGGHTYAGFGNYSVNVSIASAGGSQASAAAVADVADAPISARGVGGSAVEGTTFDGVVARFTSQNALARPGDFLATIDWGDGTIRAGTVAVATGGGFEVRGTHLYPHQGNRGLLVAVQSLGGKQAAATTQISVAGAPFAATALPVGAVERTGFNGMVGTLQISSAGMVDAAGNALVERFFVAFPQVNPGPGSDYIAQFNSNGRQASGPAQYVPASEIRAALQRRRQLAISARRGY